MKTKIIVILGQTASGKSEMAVSLAQKYKGEIVSADSRQVYKGMDLGTGKISKKEKKGIPHYLLNIASPKRKFTAAEYKKEAEKAIRKIAKKGKVPFLAGGSAFYIYSVAEGWTFPKMKPNWKLRKELEKKSLKDLFSLLKKLDSKRAKAIDRKNKRRLVRALEICSHFKKVPSLKKEQKYDFLLLGIKKEPEELRNLIKQRLEKRFKKGMVSEVRKLKKQGLSWKRLEEFGLEYKWIARYLQKKASFEEMKENLQKDIEKFAKRQMTWFKKDKRICWVKTKKQAEKAAEKFLFGK